MKRPVVAFAFLAVLATDLAADWRLALPGWNYAFPRDHEPHRDFKTEWWYFTGNLRDADGHRFGYQVTFFRQGVRPPGAPHVASRFVMNDLKFAHFAISDLTGKHYHFRQKIGRGAFGEAGFGGDALAWIDDWRLQLNADGTMKLEARDDAMSLSLELVSAKPWAIHGENGVSQKAEGEGHASHYYSGTRMNTTGSLAVGGRQVAVSGESWFDHEWATNQLTSEQIGWNWFSLQLDDGTELMLYQMRTRDGRGGGARDNGRPDLGENGTDPISSGTFIASDGSTRHLRRDDWQLTPREFWTSKETGGRYPIAWEVAVPSLDLKLTVTTALKDQELVLKPIVYWEGAVDCAGASSGRSVRGHGYLELTGYAGALVGLSN